VAAGPLPWESRTKRIQEAEEMMTGTAQTTSGVWSPGLAYLRIGAGDTLVFLPGLSGDHALPSGTQLSFEVRQLRSLADSGREVVWLNRRIGLLPQVTMADIAADYASVIQTELDPPVDVIGLSTGGSVALQLAVDHPQLVRTLVITSAAYRLSDRGRLVQQQMAAHLKSGRPRRAGAVEFAATAAGPVGSAVLSGVGWAMGRRMFGKSDGDLLAVIAAEDAFDVRDRLGRVTARTLVIGAERDRFYSPELFRDTAVRIPRGRLLLYPRTGHMGTLLRRRYLGDVRAFLDGT
jgi:pimeloyl-ACP methyl ester carboxylesterase